MAKISKSLIDLSKLPALDGTNYKRWSQKILIAFEQIEIDYVLTTNPPTSTPTTTPSTTPQITFDDNQSKVDEEKILKFTKDNKTARGYMLSHMSDPLFDLFYIEKSAKTIWEALEKKYGADDAGKRKYVTGEWLDFEVTDDKPIMDQVHKYENLVADILAEGMKMCEILQANVLICKLPESWTDYRNKLKHKKRDLTLEELVSHLKIEETNRLKDKNTSPNELSVKANLVESSGVKENRFSNKKNQKKSNVPNKKPATHFKKPGKIQKKNMESCYICGKPGHKAYQCFKRHDATKKPNHEQTKGQANLAETEDIIAAVISEVNLVGNIAEWIVDTGASRHFCANKDMFTEFEKTEGGEEVFMGNSSSSEVLGKGKVLLKLTSGKTLALQNVLYVPSLRRNLISGALLNKVGIKLVFEADKLVLTRNGEYVGKGYLNGGLFVLDTIISEPIKGSTSAYIVESSYLWHNRLGHVNINALKRLKDMNLVPNLVEHDFSKCEICVEAKFAKKPFKSVTNKTTELLELIHTDLADFRNTESRGGKKYYITFVDDHSKFTRVYLLKTKDEAEKMFMIYKTEVENQLDRKIKRLRSDRGGEYGTTFLKELCETNGIIHEVSAPRTPQQNGTAERKNRTLKNMMNAMLISSGSPNNLWGGSCSFSQSYT